jgi:alkylhydroperoxidase family enzyme
VPNAGVQALKDLDAYLSHSTIEPSLRSLVALRAAQLNECAEGTELYRRVALSHGIAEKSLAQVAVWRRANCFSAREQAALAWAEIVTLVRRGETATDVLDFVRRYFSDAELFDLTLIVAEINLRGRLLLAVQPRSIENCAASLAPVHFGVH